MLRKSMFCYQRSAAAAAVRNSPLVNTSYYQPNVTLNTMTVDAATTAVSDSYPCPEDQTTLSHFLALPQTHSPVFKDLKAANNLDLVQRWKPNVPDPVTLCHSPTCSSWKHALWVSVDHFGPFAVPKRFTVMSPPHSNLIEVYLTPQRCKSINAMIKKLRGGSSSSAFRFSGVTGEGKSHMLVAAVALVREGKDISWNTTTDQPELSQSSTAGPQPLWFVPELSALTVFSASDLADSVLHSFLLTTDPVPLLANNSTALDATIAEVRRVADVCAPIENVVITPSSSSTASASNSDQDPLDQLRQEMREGFKRMEAMHEKRFDGLQYEMRQGFRSLRAQAQSPAQYADALLHLIQHLGMSIAIDEENVLYDTLEGVSEDGHSRFQAQLNTVGAAVVNAIEGKGNHDKTVLLSSASTPVTLHEASSIEVLPVDPQGENTVLANKKPETIHRFLETFTLRRGGDAAAMQSMNCMLRAAQRGAAGIEFDRRLAFDRRLFFLDITHSPPKLVPMKETRQHAYHALVALAWRAPVHYHPPGFQYEIFLARYLADKLAKGATNLQPLRSDTTTASTYVVNTARAKLSGYDLKPGIGHALTDKNTNQQGVAEDIMNNAYWCDSFHPFFSSKAKVGVISYYLPSEANLPGEDFYLAIGEPKSTALTANSKLKFDDFNWKFLVVEASLNPNKKFSLLDISSILIDDINTLAGGTVPGDAFQIVHVLASERLYDPLELTNPQTIIQKPWQASRFRDDKWRFIHPHHKSTLPSVYQTEHMRLAAHYKFFDAIKKYDI